jgi:hypothetical protein
VTTEQLCPTCGRPLPVELNDELEQVVRAVASVDRAVRARERAAARTDSPYKAPAGAVLEVGR